MEFSLKAAALFDLQRHHLVERVSKDRLLDVVDDILGVNAQGALNSYMGLWNRIRGLKLRHIVEALYVDKSLVKTWLMRNTVHIVSSRLLPLYRRALLRSLLDRWNRWALRTGVKRREDEWESIYPRILGLLSDGPLTVGEMLRILGWRGAESRRLLGRVVREMSLRGLLCHAEAEGPWYHAREYRFARVDHWLGVGSAKLSEVEAGRELAMRYLRAYGPASPGISPIGRV